MIENERKVDKELVHKSDMDDVLIYDSRHLLPAWLASEVMTQAKAELNETEFLELARAYPADGERHVRRTIPSRLAIQALAEAGQEALQAELLGCYELVGDTLVLSSSWVLESTEAKLARWARVEAPLDVEARCRLYALLTRLDSCAMQGMQYFTLFNDTRNYFFYRKHHEHVPGLMLIEVARQAMYAQFYQHSGYARGEVSISILELLSTFPRYTESSYQVDVLVCDFDEQPQLRARKVDKRARFYQAGELVADIRLRGEVIKMPVFKRMRNISIDQSHRFRPLKCIRPEVLVSFADGQHISGELKLLSMSELQIHSDSASASSITAKQVPDQCYLYVESIGLICLPLLSVSSQVCPDGYVLNLRVETIEPRLRFKWREVLKQFASFSHVDASSAPTTPSDTCQSVVVPVQKREVESRV